VIEENKYQISALIWAEEKIEEKIFFRCLKSLSWCHQILLINIPSSFLKNIPPKIKEKVTRLELSGNQIKQLNMAIKKAKTRWIFFVKANEQISKELAQEIKKFIQRADKEGYTGAFVIHQNKIFHQKINYGRWGKKKVLRIGRRVGEWQKNISLVWHFPGQKEVLSTPLIAHPHLNLTNFLKEIDIETSEKAKVLYQEGKKTNLFNLFFFPLLEFLNSYFWQGGILDKGAGFILAVLSSFEVFLTRAKLWVLWRQNGGWQR